MSIPFPIFAALDQQWRTFASDADTYTALQRWRHSERILAGLHSAEEVLACRHEHLRADPILAVLVRRPAANSSSSVRSTSTILVFELRGQPWRSPKLLRTPTVWPSPSPVDVAAVRVPRSGQPTAMGFPRTVAGFYRYTEEEDLLARSPAVHLRRPRLDYESHATGLDRNEVGALLVAAGLASAMEHALVSLLAINGLRISEALGADIEALGVERGHRTLTVNRKGGKVVTIPLAPRVARAIDLCTGEQVEGPIFLCPNGERLDRYDRARVSLDRHATYIVAAFLAGAAR